MPCISRGGGKRDGAVPHRDRGRGRHRPAQRCDRPIDSLNVPPALAEAAELCKQIRTLERRYGDERDGLELARDTARRRILADLRGPGIKLADHELEQLVVEAVGLGRHRAPGRTARELRAAIARLYEIGAGAATAAATHRRLLKRRLELATGAELGRIPDELHWVDRLAEQLDRERRRWSELADRWAARRQPERRSGVTR